MGMGGLGMSAGHMGGMMTGSAGTMPMTGSMMALGLLWMALVAVALVYLIVLLIRSVTHN
jgi:hypothetical protein